MSKVAVVYWSGTGNTEAMAQKVAEGARGAGAETQLFTACEFDASKMDEFDAIAFGCPSMGSEQLEDSEFEPNVRRLPREARAKDCAVRFLRLGRRRVDARMGSFLQGRRRGVRARVRHLQRSPRR